VKRTPDTARAAARERLVEVAAEHSLDDAAVERLARVLDAITSDPHAPTKIKQPLDVVDVHFADSLSALPLVDELGSERIADVGSGAGYPGLPLAIARPQIEVDLVETSRRTCVFLARMLELVGLERLRVVNRRVEEWGREAGREHYDLVVMRAMAPFPILFEYAAPLLRERGALLAWKGRAEPMATAAEVAEMLGLEAERVVATQPFPASRDRHLHLYRRVRPVPESFPRRPGMARKRPLGGLPPG
jgi:16S rRNA (guanine527-N7)-methyltransferase